MKQLLIITAILISTAAPAFAYNMQCGFKPFAPIGCSGSTPVCSCDGNDNCQWVFIGCGN